MIWLILSALAIAVVVAVQFTRPRGLRLPPPKLPAEPIAQRELFPHEIEEIKRQQRQQAKMDSGKRAWIPKPGHVWNPMRNYPRNAKCTCGSGKKFKVCCLPKLPEVCPEQRAPRLKGLVKLAESGVNVPMELARAQAKLREHEALRESAHPARPVGSA